MSSLLTNTAVAVFAGALGSVLTLSLTSQLSVDDTETVPTDVMSDAPLDRDIGNDTLMQETHATTEDLQSELMVLRESLANASAERSQLSETIIQLTRQLDDLDDNVQELDATQQSFQVWNNVVAEVPARDEMTTDQTLSRDDASELSNGQRRVQNLIAAGVDEQTARGLQSRRDQYQLARLELFDQAAREGWSDSDQLTERLAELETDRVDIRSELGDDGYDRYLFESGASNRVNIGSIISGSAADLGGLLIGDLIISYAGERIFQVRELQASTRAGIRGEYVQLVFERDGQPMSTDVPRGPLGVTLGTSRVNP